MLGLLTRHRVVAIVRAGDAGAAIATARVLFDAGIALVEVSLTTPNALSAIDELARQARPDSRVGAGTVLTAADAAAAADAGASFVVTPAVTESIAAAVKLGLPVLAGAQTPTEVLAAMGAGASAVKLFPASFGGPGYLKALREPFPTIPFIPVGGVDLAAAREYLRLGAVAVGVGGPLVGDAVTGGSLTALRDRAKDFMGLAEEFA